MLTIQYRLLASCDNCGGDQLATAPDTSGVDHEDSHCKRIAHDALYAKGWTQVWDGTRGSYFCPKCSELVRKMLAKAATESQRAATSSHASPS